MTSAAPNIGPSDADLVRRAKAGDAEAFGVLVGRYQDRIYNTLFRMCRNHADALDLAQTTFLKALQALPRFEARAGFYTWIFRIAMNLAISHRRSRQRIRLHSLDAEDREGRNNELAADDDEHADGSGALERAEQLDRLERGLERLEPEFRAAIVLKDIEGLDYAEIAEILDVPLGTVKSRIFRGRTMLRDWLTEEMLRARE